jgi:hypothetical protein
MYGATVDRDSEHLNILSIIWYIMSGLAGLMGCVPFIHIALGIAITSGSMGGRPGDNFVGLFFIVAGSLAVLFMWTGAILAFMTGRSLKRRTRRILCFVTAGMFCLQIPFGLTLAIFTFIVLSRPSIRATFQ